jgi:hypothetical protein
MLRLVGVALMPIFGGSIDPKRIRARPSDP